MTPAELLVCAQQVLDAAPASTAGNSARLAAVVARQSLEAEICRRCAALGVDVGEASMRSRLLVLRALDDRDTADRLSLLWSQLSGCCHQHAYELSPTATEVRGLCTALARAT